MARLVMNATSDLTKALKPWTLMGGKRVDDMMQAYRTIGWNVTKEQLFTGLGEKVDTYATIRHNGDGSRTILGDKLGNGYKILQNINLLNATNQLNDAGCLIRVVGDIDHGKKVFTLSEIPGDLIIGDSDILKRFIIITNDHCGRATTTVEMLATREVCTNGARITNLIGKIRMRHTGDNDIAFDNVIETIDVSNQQFLIYGERMDRLTQYKNINQNDVTRYVKTVFFHKLSDSELIEKQDMVKRVTNRINELFQAGPGAETKEASGTAYGLYHAVNRYLNYDSRSSNRQASLLFGTNQGTDKRALDQAELLLTR